MQRAGIFWGKQARWSRPACPQAVWPRYEGLSISGCSQCLPQCSVSPKTSCTTPARRTAANAFDKSPDAGSVEHILPAYEAQLRTYLRLSGIKTGLLLNFLVPVMKDGIRRMSM